MDLVTGIAVGAVLCAIYFTLSYSSVRTPVYAAHAAVPHDIRTGQELCKCGVPCSAQVHVLAAAVVPSLSGAVRTASERTVLLGFAPRMAVVTLSGCVLRVEAPFASP